MAFADVLDGGGIPVAPFAVLVLIAFGLPLLTQAAFASGVVAGLARLNAEHLSVGRLLGGVWRARGSVLRLSIFRSVLGGLGPLYDAIVVFLIPVALAERLGYGSAQRRSEELVASRWGPGRFRALGLPMLNPASLLYRWEVRRFERKGAQVGGMALFGAAALPCLLIFTRSVPVVVIGWGLIYGGLIAAMLVFYTLGAPFLQGLLRAHLYQYATTRSAAHPYMASTLHACLREEARATFGLPQRQAGGPAPGEPTGLLAAGRRVRSGGWGYAEQEAGVTRANIGTFFTAAHELWRDQRSIMKAVRDAGPDGLDRAAILSVTGLSENRCRAAIMSLLQTGPLQVTLSEDGVPRYAASGRRTVRESV